MKIAILGCGALGLLWGARLSQLKNLETVLITRTGEQQQCLCEKGLIFTSFRHQTRRIPVRAEQSSQITVNNPFDVVFVTVKQIHLADVIPLLQTITHPESQILFWQNGLGHGDQIARLRRRPWTYAAVTTEGAWKKRGNEVEHTGLGETWIGAFPKAGQPHPALLSLLDMIQGQRQDFGISLNYDSQVLRRIWEKMAINCVINPLTAIDQVKNGELLSGEYTVIMEEILSETLEVAAKQGIVLDREDTMAKVRMVCRKTAGNYSSMLQDLQKGRRTEIDFINGAVVELGKKNGIDAPINQEMVRLIHARETG
ncbi:ketopantoate reductase family protein [Paenactinomyces guangxiensis]|uniref:2-dehydropantoate 2-reductase n=1 Tax=Paenactinomyces guangxiensis TaxID=1490290 RepID=A0A7W1WQM0_9BACL|nr:2-dehydropantoate 2-reductase [Paenactinomyces guangxiensis]MBA4494260.1 2-dehydropantoate 2-reductase [Paenactinomyces guangxiensis]MBH8590756.1 2-dehydropantoate 2-reductase [Paenactinomyces guangxiensis]